VSREDVIDEIADVRIICRQLTLIFGVNDVDEREIYKAECLRDILIQEASDNRAEAE